MGTVTASILIGGRHRYRGGIQPGWLLLLHEGSGTTVQFLRLHLFEGEQPGNLDEQPGIRWTLPPQADLVGTISLMLQVHVVKNPTLTNAVRAVPHLLTAQTVKLDRLSDHHQETFRAAAAQARTVGNNRCLAVTALPKTSLDTADLMTLPDWEIDLAHSVRSRDWNPFEERLVHHRRLPDLLKDSEIALSRFVTGVVFGGLAGPTVTDFIERAAAQGDENTADALGRWIVAGLAAVQQTGAFENGEAAALAPVLEDLTPNQSRLLSGFLPAQESETTRTGTVLHGSGIATTDLQDLFVLACRVTGHAVALTSNAFHLPPWLVLDALDPATPRGIPDYV